MLETGLKESLIVRGPLRGHVSEWLQHCGRARGNKRRLGVYLFSPLYNPLSFKSKALKLKT